MMTRITIAGWLLLAVAAAACTDTAGPAEPEPGPTLESRWDMAVTVRYVRASATETCDGTTLFGNVNPGEYQYRIVASLGSTRRETESRGYGTVTGASHGLGPSEIHNFGNQTWNFTNLRAGESVGLTLFSTEWDGLVKDDYMDNLNRTLGLTPSTLRPAGGSSTDRALGVGTSMCGLTLYYDVDITQRQVEIG